MKNLSGKPFALIGVHLDYGGDDATKVKRIMVKEQLDWRSFVDRGPIAAKWKPAGTPSFYIIDSRGMIRHKWAGAPAAKAIDVALENLIKEAEASGKDLPGAGD